MSKSSYPKDASYQQPPGPYPPAYPSAPPSYPTAPPPYSAEPYPPSGQGAQAPPSYGPPLGPAAYPMHGGYPPQTTYPAPMPPHNHPPSNYNPGYPVQPGFQYNPNTVAVATFDSGARFDGVATPNIPPPPPGCAPNAAQMAAAHGNPVLGTQKKASWFSGGSGGGYSFW